MTQDKHKLKIAKSTHKSIKRNHRVLYNNLRDELIRSLVKSQTPEWNSLRFTITKTGV